jgi:hypothetical protein
MGDEQLRELREVIEGQILPTLTLIQTAVAENGEGINAVEALYESILAMFKDKVQIPAEPGAAAAAGKPKAAGGAKVPANSKEFFKMKWTEEPYRTEQRGDAAFAAAVDELLANHAAALAKKPEGSEARHKAEGHLIWQHLMSDGQKAGVKAQRKLYLQELERADAAPPLAADAGGAAAAADPPADGKAEA